MSIEHFQSFHSFSAICAHREAHRKFLTGIRNRAFPFNRTCFLVTNFTTSPPAASIRTDSVLLEIELGSIGPVLRHHGGGIGDLHPVLLCPEPLDGKKLLRMSDLCSLY